MKLKLSEIPNGLNLIVCDTNSHTEKVEIDLVIMVKKVEDNIFRFTFEQTSLSGKWKSPETMKDYFDDRKAQLLEIQRDTFKLVLVQDEIINSKLLLKYSTEVQIESSEELVGLVTNQMDLILEYCRNFNL